MDLTPKYGSHLPVLAYLLTVTSGPVLELGAGLTSTPFLHWLTSPKGRELVSYDNDPAYFSGLRRFQDEHHKLFLVDDWDKAEIERPWDIAFIDHAPACRRAVEIRRLAGYATYIVAHDSYWKQDHHYHYKEIYPLFRYRFDYRPYTSRYMPMTTILSNTVDVSRWTPYQF